MKYFGIILILAQFADSHLVIDNSQVKFRAESDDLCDNQLEYINRNYDKNVLWAKIMRDSWGNFPVGIYSGNFYDFGNYDQCIRFTHVSEEYGEFHGQHCTIVFQHNLKDVDTRGKFAPTSPYTFVM